ncbi:acyl-CoA dehydrogenase family protein [Jatrophihabitans sp. DSM 45814]
MDLDLTDEQKSLQETLRRFLETEAPLARIREQSDFADGYQQKYWQQLAEFGLTSMLVPAELGGGSLTDAPIEDLSIMAEEIGRAVAAGPFVPCNVVAAALSNADQPGRFTDVVAGLVGGELTAAWAVAEPLSWDGRNCRTRVTEANGNLMLNGGKILVEGLPTADHFLVVAQAPDGLVQVLVPAGAPGVMAQHQNSLDLVRRFGSVEFTDVAIPADAIVSSASTSAADIERQLQIAIALQCAETVGAVDRVFDMTLEYVQTRVAFGRPIGSYQALKHRLADHKMWLEASFGLAAGLAQSIAAKEAITSELASVAKVHIDQHAVETIQDCVQMFGGIGLTWEHDIHLFLRRVSTNYALYGTPDDHRERLCGLAGL